MPRQSKPWSSDDLSALETMVSQGQSAQQIAAALGRTREAIEGKLYRLGRSVNGQPSATRKPRKRRTTGASFFLS
jgi:hypothetical protein